MEFRPMVFEIADSIMAKDVPILPGLAAPGLSKMPQISRSFEIEVVIIDDSWYSVDSRHLVKSSLSSN